MNGREPKLVRRVRAFLFGLGLWWTLVAFSTTFLGGNPSLYWTDWFMAGALGLAGVWYDA